MANFTRRIILKTLKIKFLLKTPEVKYILEIFREALLVLKIILLSEKKKAPFVPWP
jgi:hypothetical protein